jgi:hypothetical protein
MTVAKEEQTRQKGHQHHHASQHGLNHCTAVAFSAGHPRAISASCGSGPREHPSTWQEQKGALVHTRELGITKLTANTTVDDNHSLYFHSAHEKKGVNF